MRKIVWTWKFKFQTILWLALLGAGFLLCGCQSCQAPLSPGAATFKKEIVQCLTNLSASLKEPMARGDQAGITAALQKMESPAVKLCSLCPFQMGVLKPSGETLAVYPPKKADEKPKDFSKYDLIIKTINTKKIQQQRFFLQNGTVLYIICAPLIRDDAVLGLIVIAINSEEATKRWDLTEKEFLAIDFNT